MDWLPISLLCAFSLAAADTATKAWLSDYRARELTLVRFTTTGLLMSPLVAGIGPLTRLSPDFWLWIVALVPLEMSAMQYMDAEEFGAFYFLLLGIVAVLLFAIPQPRTLVRIWRRPWAVIAVGLLNGAMVYTHFLALQRVEVAYMIAVKRTSLLFGILFGALFFRERGLAVHILAGGLMLGGVFLIAL